MAAASFDDFSFAARGAVRDALLERVRRAIDRAQALPIVAAEEREYDDLRPLLADVVSSIDDTHSLLGEVLDHYEQTTDLDELDFDFDERPSTMVRVVENHMGEEGGVSKITGIAFVARIGLRGRRDVLLNMFDPRDSRPHDDQKWELIAYCSSAVREILKSLAAIEMAIAEHEGLTAVCRYYVSELDRALQVRRAYVTFRNEVIGQGTPEPTDAPRRLRVAASAIAKLIGRPAYAFARVHDRSNIRRIQVRIREQLTANARVANESIDPRDQRVLELGAVRLWQDLANVAELVMAINNRAELREHDRSACEKALACLRASDVEGALGLLRDSCGRDAQLDKTLAERAPTVGALEEAVESVLGALVRVSDEDGTASDDGRRRRATDRPSDTQHLGGS